VSEAIWTSAEIAGATGGTATAAFTSAGLSIDTRTIRPGELFIALTDARDGHDFVPNAFEKGAAGALVSRQVGNGPQVIVDDVMVALEQLGVAARERAGDAHRVAITGSVGKTSVKEMVARIFRAAGPAHWSVKSFNNHWGVPLTLAGMPAETRNAVFEIGMSTPGEIAPRSNMVRPHAGLITKIAPAHLEGVGSIEGVADEKSDIFAGLEEGGAILLPARDRFLPRLIENARRHAPTGVVLTFGHDREAFARVAELESDGRTSEIGVALMGEMVYARIDAVGEHWADNVAAALLLACIQSGIAPRDAAEALNGYAPPPGRGTAETLPLPDGGTFTLIDDAYNANPESVRAALKAFSDRPAAGKRIVALGEMREIGETSAAEHAGLLQPVLASGADILLTAGAEMEVLHSSLPGTIQAHHSVKAEGLNEILKNLLGDGDLLLLKGSNASGVGTLAEHLREYSKGEGEAVMGAARRVAKGSDAL
jgi:UDP-N-acetylmuramoyl-tripeptide--D-alanyl-D-alanine ligase